MISGGLSRETAEQLVGSAILAPSVLNTQPWLFRAHGGVIDVRVDSARTLPVLDPAGRAALISCGAALLNLRLAAQALGRHAALQLLSNQDDPLHVAQARFTGAAELTATERALYEAIPHRHTNRFPFRGEPLRAEVVAHLEAAAEAEGGMFRVLTPSEVPDVVRTIHEADRIQRDDPKVRAEVARWINRGPDARDGLSTVALGARPRDPGAVVRDFAFGYPVRGRESADFEKAASLAVLHTHGDTRMDWLCAGMALQRVLLTATTLDVAASMLTQALEVESLRGQLRLFGVVGPQVLLRLGYGLSVYPAPRRPVADVLQYTL